MGIRVPVEGVQIGFGRPASSFRAETSVQLTSLRSET